MILEHCLSFPQFQFVTDALSQWCFPYADEPVCVDLHWHGPVVIETVDNFLANNCVKKESEKHYKCQWERKIHWSCTLYIHTCAFLAAQEKAWRISCRFSCSEDIYVEDALTQGYWFHTRKAGCHTNNCEDTELQKEVTLAQLVTISAADQIDYYCLGYWQALRDASSQSY